MVSDCFSLKIMNATEIIEEIQQLDLHERKKIADFLKTLSSGQLTSQELTILSENLLKETNPEKSKEIASRIKAGFYGDL